MNTLRRVNGLHLGIMPVAHGAIIHAYKRLSNAIHRVSAPSHARLVLSIHCCRSPCPKKHLMGLQPSSSALFCARNLLKYSSGLSGLSINISTSSQPPKYLFHSLRRHQVLHGLQQMRRNMLVQILPRRGPMQRRVHRRHLQIRPTRVRRVAR